MSSVRPEKDEEAQAFISQTDQEDKKKPEYSKIKTMAIVAFYCSCSISMFLVNKLAITDFNYPNTTLFFQTIVSVLLVIAMPLISPAYDVEDVNLEKSMKWFPVVFLFACMLISSMQALAYLNVQTIVVFRNLSTIAVAIAEKVVFGNSQSPLRMASMGIIVVGAIIYAWSDFQFNLRGYVWLGINITATGAYSIMVKVTDGKVGLNSFGKVLYNNTLALPIVLLIVLLSESPAESVGAFLDSPTQTKFFLLLSCLVGFFISVAGFLMQSAVNPTSFMIANNANKIVVIVLGMYLFRTQFVVGTAVGLVIALAGGALYSYDGVRAK